jgi:hypothetical protein
MNFTITGSVSVSRVQGKFATKDEIRELIEETLSDALGGLDLSGLGADGESEYEVDDSNVEIS